jgi:hypothetical protein
MPVSAPFCKVRLIEEKAKFGSIEPKRRQKSRFFDGRRLAAKRIRNFADGI